VLWWVRRKIAASTGIVVLTFHRVVPEKDFMEAHSPPGMMVRSRTFRRLLRYLNKECEVLPLSINITDRESSLTRPRVVLTFDDGWKDTSEIAFPLVKEFGLPITVFVCPGLAGKSSPFWPELVFRAWRTAAKRESESHKFGEICNGLLPGETFFPATAPQERAEVLIAYLKELRSAERDGIIRQLSLFGDQSSSVCRGLEAAMTWEETQSLGREGAQIGSHTQHHEILTGLEDEAARREVADSKHSIESQLGKPCETFAYPNGSWSREARQLVIREGFRQAFVNVPGIWTAGTDPWLIPRVNVWEGSVTDIHGNFSAIVFQYSVFWRAYRAEMKRKSGRRSALRNEAI
jgi:peptidoglycan/xylan/chitin deacetylase (PgdA/CDA1 family)